MWYNPAEGNLLFEACFMVSRISLFYQAMEDVRHYAILELPVQPRRSAGLVATKPRVIATEIGSQLGITERPVRRIIAELEAAGYIRRTREGRVNRYEVNPVLPLPGPVFRDLAVGDLIDILQASSPEGARSLRDGSYPGS